ncbi:ketopantoate hydroxymethyltransferase [Paenibacillus arenosi]|uniref:Ketopantoate hydroxymethyltransferase n=1 Tax=Paenibacillus arenosi TaxID=2774142 RepID=A0ABR9B0Q3_9BACL|nr:ketopantoate hydroxymethyltransferase [Paenibacillus arenosi]MBD8499974.1 ketopantoate hydroxymethyltransferase [Paenibacillus arenosi]
MITASYLNDLAVYTNTRITKVVINDTHTIDQFEIKEATASDLLIKYMVRQGTVQAVNKIDLRDVNDKVISTNNVYVPITSDTLLLQRIKIREV